MSESASIKEIFGNICMTLGSGSAAGCFIFLWNLNATLAIMSSTSLRHDDEIKEVRLRIEGIRNEVSANVLEIVRVKTQCEQSQAWRPPQR
jgi:hypothetical protein